MATYKVQAPDGKTITLEGPDGASPDEVIAQAQKLYTPPTRDPVIHRTNDQLRADVATVAKPVGRVATAAGEVKDSFGRLISDVKGALAPEQPSAQVRNGALSPNASLIDRGLHALAGGDNGRGEVDPNTSGGQSAMAADRVGTDLVDLPMSLGRAAVRFMNPKIDSEAAGGYTAAALAGLPVARGALAGARAATAGALAPSAAAMDTAAMVRKFDAADIDPMLAAKGGGLARTAKVTSENALVGGQVRDRLANSVEQASASATDKATRYGSPSARGAAGEQVQAGVKGFNDRFSDRAGNLYDKAFDEIDRGQQASIDAAQKAAAIRTGQGGSTAVPEAVIKPEATQAVLGDIGGTVNASGLSKIIQDPRLAKVADALQSGATDLRFGDLRALRTWAREAQGNETLRQGISQGNLQRLESALTKDITQNAEALAGPAAARKLQQADQFYRLGSQRIQTQLQNFVGKGGNASGEQTYDLITRAASDKAGADIGRLQALKKSLLPHEWGDVAASVINRLGKAPGGSGDDFSINSFSTNYRNLSPRGKALLFGTGENRAALENLAEVTGHMKDIERMANHSNSGASAQNVASLGGLGAAGMAALTGNVAPLLAAGSALGSLRFAGDLMTNPGFVRWLARNTEAAAGKAPISKAAAINQLRTLAAKDQRLLPVLSQLSASQVNQSVPVSNSGTGN